MSFTSAFEERMWKTLIPRSRVIMARVAVIQCVVHMGTGIWAALNSLQRQNRVFDC